jgi:MFS family permease
MPPPSSPRSGLRRSLRGILVDFGPVRRDREFRLLWTAQLIGATGSQMAVVALPFELWTLTHSSLSIGLLAIVQLVPILIFALGGGAIADAVDRRRLLTVTQSLLAAIGLALAVLAVQPSPPIWAFYLIAFVAAGVGSVDALARSSTVPRLVPRQRLRAAIAVNSMGFNAMTVVGPAVAGVVIELAGVPAAFAINGVAWLASLAAIRMMAPIQPHPDAARPSLRSVAEGLRFARARRIILAAFVIDLDAMVFGMPSSLFPQLALTVFNVGASGYGLLQAAPAVGAAIGAALNGWTSRVRHPGRGVIWAVAIWGVAIVGFGLSTWSLPLALTFLAIAGAADVISAVLRNSIVQFETPDQLRGRVMSIQTLVVTGGPRIGDAEAAAVAALAGPQFSVVSGGLLCLAGLAAVVRLFPQLLHYELQHDAAHAPADGTDEVSEPVEGPEPGPAPV